jgi:two-component system nitrate/nitrite response regulator NarL
MPVQILIVDDHDVVREGVKAILQRRPDWEICGEATNGRDAVALAEALKPDVAILDITMPMVSGLDAAHELARKMPELRTLIFTMHDAKTVEPAVRRSGAHGLVLKLNASRDLIKAVETLLEGGTFFGTGTPTERRPPEEQKKEDPAGQNKFYINSWTLWGSSLVWGS